MSSDLSGFSMFELFRSEAESHSAALSEGLLAIEENPSDLSRVEQLMRAAHSIKGAARIINLDIVVELAHAMEDCFVSVQKGKETLSLARVDQLLAAVDVIHDLSKLEESKLDAWLVAQAENCQTLAERISHPVVEQSPSEATKTAVTTKTVEPEVAGVAAPEAENVEAPAEQPVSLETPTGSAGTPGAVERPDAGGVADEQAKESTADQRTVPVNASNLDRIMHLASEAMVEARQLQAVQKSLLAMCEMQRNYSQVLERLRKDELAGKGPGQSLEELREIGRKSESILQDHSVRLERALWRSERTATALYHQVAGSRMRPFIEGTQAFPRMIRDLSKSLGKRVRFEVLGGRVAVDRDILRKLEAPLNHILRNCVDHAIETPEDRKAAGKPEMGHVTLEARHHAGMLTIEVRDDGRGIDADSLRNKIVERKLVDATMAADLSQAEVFEFLFLPGFSTASQVTEVSGRGVGLDVVRSMVQEVSGTVRVDSEPGRGATFVLRLPVTLSVMRAALRRSQARSTRFRWLSCNGSRDCRWRKLNPCRAGSSSC